MKLILEILHHWFTARDNVSWSFTKLLGASAGSAMIYNFLSTQSKDYIGFGTGIAAVMAALAAKYLVEGSPNKDETK